MFLWTFFTLAATVNCRRSIEPIPTDNKVSKSAQIEPYTTAVRVRWWAQAEAHSHKNVRLLLNLGAAAQMYRPLCEIRDVMWDRLL